MKIGFTAGSFDILHPGYIDMFKTAKENCDYLIVGLHKDPSLYKSSKMKPVIDVIDRKKTIESIRYIDEVIIYETENDIINIMDNKKVYIRFLGDDYINLPYTGINDNIHVFYINRNHGWSTTKLKKLISESYDEFQRNGHI